MTRTHLIGSSTAIAAVVFTLSGCKGKTAPEAPLLTVPVAIVANATLENDLVLSAEFRPYQEVDVMAKIAG